MKPRNRRSRKSRKSQRVVCITAAEGYRPENRDVRLLEVLAHIRAALRLLEPPHVGPIGGENHGS